MIWPVDTVRTTGLLYEGMTEGTAELYNYVATILEIPISSRAKHSDLKPQDTSDHITTLLPTSTAEGLIPSN